MMQFQSKPSLNEISGAQLAGWLVVLALMVAVPAFAHAWPAEREPIVSLRVNLNEAGLDDLLSLPGMSGQRARAILKAREKKGRFAAISELNQIKGLTKNYVERIAELIEAK